jgi:parvulin-like peptidyl-prolyl isomerase
VAPAGPIAAPGPAGQPSVTPAAAASSDVATQVRVVAMIGSDVVITDDEVFQMVRQRGAEYVRLAGTARDAKEKELFQEELRRLIERELILNDFLTRIKKNKPQVLDVVKEHAQQAVTRQLKEFKRLNNFKTEAEFTEALKSQGLSMKGLQRQLERNAMMSMFLAETMREKGKTTSLAEVIRYYEEHADEFKVEDQVKWLDLFVSYRRFNTTVEARQYAEQLLQQAKAGADFVQLVKQYGHGDSPLRDGEGIGQKRGEITPKELEPTILALNKGQLSALVPTETGFHVVKVVEREHAGYRPFDEKTQLYIRNRLAGQMQKADYDKLIEDLWRKTTVRIIETP